MPLAEPDILADWRVGSANERPHDLPELGASPSLAVVVCTCGRVASLARLIESLAAHDRRPEQLVVIDASTDEATEQLVAAAARAAPLANELRYVRVAGALRGLTRQRNHALTYVVCELLVFLDDDVLLLPGCLAAMEQAIGADPAVAGVGALAADEAGPLPPIWRLRRTLGIVPALEPGRYYRSGMSTPWRLPPDATEPVEGDWLPGYAMLWRASLVRELGFYAAFAGYAQGEDLEFSLRARARGRLVIAPAARLLHLQSAGGRPIGFARGYMELLNRYLIHQRSGYGQSRRDLAYFCYAWALDTALLARSFARPASVGQTVRQIGGRLWGLLAIVRGGGSARPTPVLRR